MSLRWRRIVRDLSSAAPRRDARVGSNRRWRLTTVLPSQSTHRHGGRSLSIETNFDPAFAAALALREKQIQQNYRPLIGIHKWFARRPGTLFRNLLLAEYNGCELLEESFWHAHDLKGVIADPFMRSEEHT